MPKEAAKEPYCALYPFRAADKQDISLRPGDKLYVFDAKDDNWWFVSKTFSESWHYLLSEYAKNVNFRV